MRILKQYKGLFLIIFITFALMAGVVVVDKPWSIHLHEHQWPELVKWMNRSIFEGDAVGLSDPVIFFLLGVVLVYYLGWRGRHMKQMMAWRPQCGFVLTSALCCAVLLVHGLKWIVGRARPAEVIFNGWPYSHWFAFGPHFVTEGVFSGSFPSGHTAQMFILMTMAYVLAADPFSRKTTRVFGWLWAAACLMLASAMAVVRCMSLSHWISDCLGSILFGWAIMHLLYFSILRVPDQRRYIQIHGNPPELPPVWEIILCLYLFLATLGIMAVLIGTKALIVDKAPWLVLMVPPGAALTWLARQRALSLLQTVWTAIDSDNMWPEYG